MTLRHPSKFESSDTTISYSFSLHGLEWQSEQGFRTALASIAGADYAHDYHGFSAAPMDPGRERLRCILVESTTANLEAEIDEARSECQRIGKGKLYITDSDASVRWAWARLNSLPSMTVAVGMVRHTFMVFDFIRLSNWHGATAYDEEFPVDESPETFNVVATGNAPIYDAVIRFRANGSSGIVSPVVFTNTTNGMAFTLDIDSASADDEWRVRCGPGLVDASTDNGSNYADDSGVITLPAGQTRFMRFEPTTNAISVTAGGTPAFDVDIDFVPQYLS